MPRTTRAEAEEYRKKIEALKLDSEFLRKGF